MPPAADAFTPHASPMVLVTLAVILTASLWVFATLVRRETRHRRLVSLSLWARSHEMRLNPTGGETPPLLRQFKPKIRQSLTGPVITLLQFETSDVAATVPTSRRQWNIILHDLGAAWPTTALRPTAHTISLVDLFSLSSYPSLMPSERFMVFGVESRAARALAESTAPALLPPDIALIVSGNLLLLDFSTRHFDEIEFDRLIDLAKQLAPRLSITQ
ncbi:MAG TPA: hypothetical protein VGG44_11520 [Tepidisphaeraceae bacterium]